MDYFSPGGGNCIAGNDLKIKIKDKSKKIKVESRKNEDRRPKREWESGRGVEKKYVLKDILKDILK